VPDTDRDDAEGFPLVRRLPLSCVRTHVQQYPGRRVEQLGARGRAGQQYDVLWRDTGASENHSGVLASDAWQQAVDSRVADERVYRPAL
jgi:hypothetical protein